LKNLRSQKLIKVKKNKFQIIVNNLSAREMFNAEQKRLRASKFIVMEISIKSSCEQKQKQH
jgi:hypothetical protein